MENQLIALHHVCHLSFVAGLIPYNYICVQTGQLLTELTSTQQLMNASVFLKLSAIATVALLPSFLLRKWNASRSKPAGSYFETEETKDGQTTVRRSARLRAKID